MAQYNRALADGSSSKHGEAISRLKLAESTAKDAQRLAQGFSNVFVAANVPTLPADAGTSMVELCKNHLALCTEAKLSAISDNDLIYHDALPSEASLSAVDKAVVAEPIPIQEVYGTPEVQKVVGADIFNRLVPLSVHESASLYSEEKAKLVRAQGEACDLADGEMRAALEYMGLPASLAKFRNVGTSDSTMDALADPGPQVRGWAEAVRSSGRQRPVQQVMEDLERLKANARNDLDTAERDLDVEQRECEQARVRVGGSFSQSPSAGLTRLWRQTIKSHRDGLAQAGVSDERVMADWQAAKQDLALLMASDEALDAAFVEAVASAGGPANGEASLLDADLGEDESEAMKRRVAVIEELLGRLNKIKRERLDVFRDLKDRVRTLSSLLDPDFADLRTGPERRHLSAPHPQSQVTERRAKSLCRRAGEVPSSSNPHRCDPASSASRPAGDRQQLPAAHRGQGGQGHPGEVGASGEEAKGSVGEAADGARYLL